MSLWTLEAAAGATHGARGRPCYLSTLFVPPVPDTYKSLNPFVQQRSPLHPHHAMDSIPQELIDAIIDNIPQSDLPSCSLVAKRWQRKSQRRVLDTIAFLSEGKVKRWCTDIPQDSDGISSYVRHVMFEEIYSWTEPTLLCRLLGSLSSLTALSMSEIEIPDEFPGHLSRGEFGKGITTLCLRFLDSTVETLTLMILSLPNLKELHIEHCIEDGEDVLERPLPTYSVAPQRGPLDLLVLRGGVGGTGEALAKFRFTSRRLTFGVDVAGLEQLILLSSEMVVELSLYGVWFFSDRAETIMTDLPDVSTEEATSPIPIHLPSLPALTTLVIYIDADRPSPLLTNILCSIGSAPALTSIIIKYDSWTFNFTDHLPFADQWVNVDRWLSGIAKHAKVEGSLLLTLRGWAFWEGFLPEFRKSGGRVEVEDIGW